MHSPPERRGPDVQYIVPTVITEPMLISCSVAEDDHAEWAAATAYTLGERVIRLSTHAVYERLVAGTTAAAPEADAVNWLRVGPTNRWAMLDRAVGTATTAPGIISATIAPGVAVRSIALLDLDVEAVTVTMSVAGQVVYSSNISPIATQEDTDDFYSYCFEFIYRRRLVILTDLPAYSEGQITITATGGGDISIGTCVIGPMYELGQLLTGASIGIVDYSRKETDQFGVVSVAERSYAKKMTLPIILATNAVDVAASRLARVRATPVVWIGSELFDTLIIYGFLRDWSIDIPGSLLSTCSLEIEGLV